MVTRRALVAALVIASNTSHELLTIRKFTRAHFSNEIMRIGMSKRTSEFATMQNLDLSRLLQPKSETEIVLA